MSVSSCDDRRDGSHWLEAGLVVIIARIEDYLVEVKAERHGARWLGCATVSPGFGWVSASYLRASVIRFGLALSPEAAELAVLAETRRHLQRKILAADSH